MYCDKCGNPMTEEMAFCEKCGHKNESTVKANEKPVTTAKGDTLMLVVSICLFAFAVIFIIVGFVAAGMIASGGKEISEIRSVGGKTLEEAYYQSYGVALMGIGWLTRIVSVGLALILGYLGIKSFKKSR